MESQARPAPKPSSATGARSAESAAPAPAARRATRAAAVAAVIAVTHGTVDGYVAFLHPLLPRIMGKLGLSIALAATLVTVLSIASSLAQPALGYLADRYGRRPYLVAGPVLAGVFLSLIGVAPSFGVLVAFLLLGGMGSAAFHPPGASLAARASEGRGSGVRLSIFSFGGAAGYALGPLVAVGLVTALGLSGLAVAMVPGLLLGAALWFLLRGDRTGLPHLPPPPPMRVLRALRGPLGLLFGISAVGAFVQRTYLTFEPIIAAQAGVSEATGAAMLSVYLAAQAAGTLASGFLTDRTDRLRVLIGATALGVPAHVLAVTAAPATPLAIGAAVAAGFLNMAILPPVVVMAQEMLPEGTGVGSGIVMGLAWAVGALLILPAGVAGDVVGPVAAAAWSMPVLFLGTILALHPSLKAFSRAAAADRTHRGEP